MLAVTPRAGRSNSAEKRRRQSKRMHRGASGTAVLAVTPRAGRSNSAEKRRRQSKRMHRGASSAPPPAPASTVSSGPGSHSEPRTTTSVPQRVCSAPPPAPASTVSSGPGSHSEPRTTTSVPQRVCSVHRSSVVKIDPSVPFEVACLVGLRRHHRLWFGGAPQLGGEDRPVGALRSRLPGWVAASPPAMVRRWPSQCGPRRRAADGGGHQARPADPRTSERAAQEAESVRAAQAGR